MALHDITANQIEDLQQLRRHLVRRILQIMLIIAPWPMLFATWRAVELGTILPIVMYVIIYAALLGITFYKNISYSIQAGLLVFISFAGAIQDIISYGLNGGGSLFFLLAIFLASLLFTWRIAVLVMICMVMALMVLGILIAHWRVDLPAVQFGHSLVASIWAIRILLLLLLGSIKVWGLHYLLSRLDAALKTSQRLTQTLADSNLKLENALVHANQLTVAAEQASQAKTGFLAAMSHELRTPLNAILGFAQLLRQDLTLSSSQGDYTDMILQSSRLLLRLITDILDFSKIERQSIMLDSSDIHLNAFLKTIVELMRPQAQEKGLLWHDEIDNNLPLVIQSDKERLYQIIMNLLGNAIKFTPQGKVTFAVRLLNKQQTTCRLRFEVTDTGIGIREEQLGKLFLPFEQLGGVLTDRADGTGLGLAMTHRLVHLMEGEIQVKSQWGDGSRFWVDLTLPMVAGEHVEEKLAQEICKEELPKELAWVGLAALPDSLLVPLEEAASQADMIAVEQIIEEVAQHDQEAATRLVALADEFEYGQVLDLIRAARMTANR